MISMTIWIDALLFGIYVGASIYAGVMWWLFRFLRLLMLFLVALGMTVIYGLDALLLTGTFPLSFHWGLAAQAAAHVVTAIAFAFVMDLTAASLNSHRAVTTILYKKWIEVSSEERKHE